MNFIVSNSKSSMFIIECGNTSLFDDIVFGEVEMPVRSGESSAEAKSLKRWLLDAEERKKDIEREIEEYTAVLNQNGIGMREPLVDRDDYPRSDIDVYRVRTARNKIICLQNDYKALMNEISEALYKYHSLNQSSDDSSCSTSNLHSTDSHMSPVEPNFDTSDYHSNASASRVEDVSQNSSDQDENTAFMKPIVLVNFVNSNSPADIAGLKVGDRILEFGSVNSTNMTNLNDISDVVRRSVNKPILLKVRRSQGDVCELSVTPQTWSGAGLLGCNMLVDSSE